MYGLQSIEVCLCRVHSKQTGTTLFLIKNSQILLKDHLLLLTLSTCCSVSMGQKLAPIERQEGKKEIQLLQDISTLLALDMNSLFCQMFQINVVCLQLVLCLKAEINELHSGFLSGTVIQNYGEEEDTLIMENSVTDL